MINKIKIRFLLGFFAFSVLITADFFAQEREITNPKKVYTTSVVGNKVRVKEITYVPKVEYKQVAVYKNVYKNGKLARTIVGYETKKFVTYKTRSKNKYYPMVK